MTPTADSEEDFRIFQVLCSPGGEMSDQADMNTTLRSELAALQYKRDSLLLQLQEAKSQVRKKEERCAQLEGETEQIKEQAARQNVVIASLRKRIQELEEKERLMTAGQARTDMTMSTLQRENRYHEEKAADLERKVSKLELELNAEEQEKALAQKALGDLMRQLETALGAEATAAGKAHHLVQETGRLRSRVEAAEARARDTEEELLECRAALGRATAERDSLHTQAATHLAEIDRIRQEKEKLELQCRLYERELSELRDKLTGLSRSLHVTTGDMQIQESTIRALREELKDKEERSLRLDTELRHLLESLAILLSSPVRFVESNELSIKERIRDLLSDAKDKSMQVDSLHEKIGSLRDQVGRLTEQRGDDMRRLKEVEEDKMHLEGKLQKTEVELSACQAAKEGLRRDKAIFVTFLERLARALNMEEISREVGVDLHTESMLLRAEQLAKLESDKLADKSAVVYQLQRRVRNLRDQLQRRDLHLDLLRKKLTLQEDNCRTKGLLQAERDEANLRVKKLSKQVDRLQLQLNEARALTRDLKLQLTENNDFKMTALERGRKIDELQKRLAESEMLRTRCSRKMTLLKDQVRVTGESAEEMRAMGEGVAQALRDEVESLRNSLVEANRTKSTLNSLRNTLCTTVGLPVSCPDYELISRVTKMSDANREFTKVSRRYDTLPAVSPRFIPPDDPVLLDTPPLEEIDSDINSIYNKRPSRNLLT
ncbi:coiled-coil domain-containing protein 170 isoform X2 [Halyomorpha halys]|uniref:coiled-coil domain-containing protein 170 isoform X2 n=1 Tax=Halyomorpha halys TaxID=286706 RepID=UPI0006D4EF86|nr:coiled-coil domain-containing protein 170 isoform X2 [Halyomorpha halys]